MTTLIAQHRSPTVVILSAVLTVACSANHHTAPTSTPPAAAQQTGRLRFHVTDDTIGSDLPTRLTIHGIEGTTDPSLGSIYQAAGAGSIVVAASGQGETTLPTGHYSLVFSHGPEWSIDQRRIVVDGNSNLSVTASLHHVIPMDDWTACDFHVHAAPSFDSQVTVQDRVAALVAEGIAFAVPSEHNIVGDYGPGILALPPAASSTHQGPGLTWVPAVEITTDVVGNPVGHFNAFPYPPTPGAEHGGPPDARLSPPEIFRAVRMQNPNAVIQVNHPRMPGLGYFDTAHLDPSTNRGDSAVYDPSYTAIEVFNGFYAGEPPRIDNVLHDWLALLSTGARYVGTANSDSHDIGYHQAGYPRTYVYTPGTHGHAPDPEVVLSSLRAGRAFGTDGPILFVGSGESTYGATVQTHANEFALQIRVMAAPWIAVDQIEIYRDGQLFTTLMVQPTRQIVRLEQTVSVPLVSPRSFFVVVARAQEPLDSVLPRLNARPYAFTNPIWVERTQP